MHARRTSRTAEPPTIDGEAVVIGRRPGAAAARASPNTQAPPTNDNRPPEAETCFPQRAARPVRPDLVFPGTVRWPGARERSGGSPLGSGRRRMLAAAGCLGAAAIAVALAAAPFAGGAASAASPPAFALTDARGGVAARGDGAVLTVEGRIRNLSGEARSVPALVVHLPGNAGFTRTVRPGAKPLGPGRSLFFHSTLAVPLATTAAGIGIAIAAEGPETTLTP